MTDDSCVCNFRDKLVDRAGDIDVKMVPMQLHGNTDVKMVAICMATQMLIWRPVV